MRTQPGRRDEVVAILLEGTDRLAQHGCRQYVVGTGTADDVTVWVSELWDSREAHDASLQLPEVREAIGRAMPMLTGEFTSTDGPISGGLGA
ncbi:MAG: antibiotic biosynthesis monooxygenase [Actinomycetota bacterium]|nr:antibiotic biosynthesis monooxygenase [Actinomycetota bacterium]